MPRQWLARALAVLWMFTGVLGGVEGHEYHVSRPRRCCRRELRAEVHEVSKIDNAYQALLNKDADAVVFDAPVLLYAAANENKGRVHMVGTIFRKEDYGIVFRQGSPLRKLVNNELLSLRGDGTYQQLYDEWFTGK